MLNATSVPTQYAGVYANGVTVHNLSDTDNVYLGADSSLTPSTADFTVTPGSAVPWPSNIPLFFVADDGKTVPFEAFTGAAFSFNGTTNITSGEVDANITGPVTIESGDVNAKLTTNPQQTLLYDSGNLGANANGTTPSINTGDYASLIIRFFSTPSASNPAANFAQTFNIQSQYTNYQFNAGTFVGYTSTLYIPNVNASIILSYQGTSQPSGTTNRIQVFGTYQEVPFDGYAVHSNNFAGGPSFTNTSPLPPTLWSILLQSPSQTYPFSSTSDTMRLVIQTETTVSSVQHFHGYVVAAYPGGNRIAVYQAGPSLPAVAMVVDEQFNAGFFATGVQHVSDDTTDATTVDFAVMKA